VELSPRDISALALIVTNPAMPSDLLEKLIDSMEGDEARLVARALTSEQSFGDERVRGTAEALRAWAGQDGTGSGELVSSQR